MIDFFLNTQTIYTLIVLLLSFAAYQFLSIKYPNIAKRLLSSLKGQTTNKAQTPMLDTYTIDFTQLAREKESDPVVGRQKEIIRLAQVLSRRGKNNAILVGAPGVGKTAIVEALAQRIASGDVPETLKGKRVLALDVATLLSGTKYRGEFEQRAKKIVKEIQSAKRQIVLFIDEIHSIIQSQGTEGSVNFSDILKPALARGDLQMIGATTWMEYEKYIRVDASLERRFQPITVLQPTEEQAEEIMKGIKQKYEEYHKVAFTDAALKAAVHLTHDEIKNRTLPDKAIDAIDEAASLVRVEHITDATDAVLYEAAIQKHPELKTLWKSIQELDQKILSTKTKKQKESLVKKREKVEKKLEGYGILSVDVSDIEQVISQWLSQENQ